MAMNLALLVGGGLIVGLLCDLLLRLWRMKGEIEYLRAVQENHCQATAELSTVPIQSAENIYQFLLQQANMRAPENDEGGILMDLAEELIKRLVDLDPNYYGGLNAD